MNPLFYPVSYTFVERQARPERAKPRLTVIEVQKSDDPCLKHSLSTTKKLRSHERKSTAAFSRMETETDARTKELQDEYNSWESVEPREGDGINRWMWETEGIWLG